MQFLFVNICDISIKVASIKLYASCSYVFFAHMHHAKKIKSFYTYNLFFIFKVVNVSNNIKLFG